MIVADTGAILALLDTDDRHHRHLRRLYDDGPDQWLLPWAILAYWMIKLREVAA